MKRTMIVGVAVLALLIGVVAYAQAAGTQVVVTAAAGDKMEIRVANGFETWAPGAVVPDGVSTTARTIQVRSNLPFKYQSTVTKDTSGTYGSDYTLASAFETQQNRAKTTPGNSWADLTDTLTLTMGWMDTGTNIRATVDYTVTP